MPVDFSIAWKSGARILDKIISLLPNIVLGIAIFVLFLLAASLAKSLIRRRVLLRRLPAKGWRFSWQDSFTRLSRSSVS